MSKSTRQGNNYKFVRELTLDDTVYNDLTSVDIVIVRLENNDDETIFIQMDSVANPTQVTIDDPTVGSVSWQLLSADTSALPVGIYTLSIEIRFNGSVDVYEFEQEAPFRILKQRIT